MSLHTQSSTGTSGNGATVGQHFQVGKKIGEGSFGVVFEGINTLTGQPVAIKFEPRKSNAPQLRDEYRSYRILNGVYGVPQVYYFGQEGLHNVLVIDLFGPNLEDLFDLCGRKFTIKTVCMAARQMITRVQSIHEKNLIYRDIKPDNFLIGPPGSKNAGTVYIIDFGMAKLWRDPKTKQHIPYKERKSLSGTARYMSINTHLGREQSRRDDLEGLGHVFMYFLRGGLPWQGLKAANNKQKYEKIGEKKQTTDIKDLCAGLPEEFGIYLNYVRTLGFEEDPDYNFLRDLFGKVLKDMNEVEDGVFDWMLLNGGKGWEAGPAPASFLPNGGHQTGNATGQRPRERQHRSSGQPGLSPSPGRQQTKRTQKHTSTSPLAPNANSLIPPLATLDPAARNSPTSPSPVGGQHPYASPVHSNPYGNGGLTTPGRDSYNINNALNASNNPVYGTDGRNSAVPSVSTALSPNQAGNARIRGEQGMSSAPGVDTNGRPMAAIEEEHRPKGGLVNLLLCRCG